MEVHGQRHEKVGADAPGVERLGVGFRGGAEVLVFCFDLGLAHLLSCNDRRVCDGSIRGAVAPGLGCARGVVLGAAPVLDVALGGDLAVASPPVLAGNAGERIEEAAREVAGPLEAAGAKEASAAPGPVAGRGRRGGPSA